MSTQANGRPLKDNWIAGRRANRRRMTWAEILKSEQGLKDKGVAGCDFCHKYHVQLTPEFHAELTRDPEFHKAAAGNYVTVQGIGVVLVVGNITVEIIADEDPKSPKWARCPLKGKRVNLSDLFKEPV